VQSESEDNLTKPREPMLVVTYHYLFVQLLTKFPGNKLTQPKPMLNVNLHMACRLWCYHLSLLLFGTTFAYPFLPTLLLFSGVLQKPMDSSSISPPQLLLAWPLGPKQSDLGTEMWSF
jgi:hypothetical protein